MNNFKSIISIGKCLPPSTLPYPFCEQRPPPTAPSHAAPSPHPTAPWDAARVSDAVDETEPEAEPENLISLASSSYRHFRESKKNEALLSHRVSFWNFNMHKNPLESLLDYDFRAPTPQIQWDWDGA